MDLYFVINMSRILEIIYFILFIYIFFCWEEIFINNNGMVSKQSSWLQMAEQLSRIIGTFVDVNYIQCLVDTTDSTGYFWTHQKWCCDLKTLSIFSK